MTCARSDRWFKVKFSGLLIPRGPLLLILYVIAFSYLSLGPETFLVSSLCVCSMLPWRQQLQVAGEGACVHTQLHKPPPA